MWTHCWIHIHVRRIISCRIQNPDIHRAGWGGAGRGGAGRGASYLSLKNMVYQEKRTKSIAQHIISQRFHFEAYFHRRRSGPLDDLGEGYVPLSGQPTKTSLTSLWKHEQLKPYVNRRWNKTRGWQPVHNWFISRTTAAIRSWMLTSRPTPLCLCKPFSSQGCPGIQAIDL